ncbi:hypothetical protein CCGE525_37315 (plasmid) [Rhizobium jaguaris]|uniref:Uncharacterized protein n=2 Tax=Rhizobium jaguaris TaxID=1312183 RepID=A0A387G8C5_9HYPH|nr:hypothetical protein CCGE525_37315 [Rhizobium jaguaris]
MEINDSKSPPSILCELLRGVSTKSIFDAANMTFMNGPRKMNMAMDAISIIVVSVPHTGLSKNSARGFALDQFARHQGYPSFAEWSVHCFDQALQISGEVREKDSIDVAENSNEKPEGLLSTFGYEVVLRLWRTEENN